MNNTSTILISILLCIHTVYCVHFNKDIQLVNRMDDSIGRTDYLITLYSTETIKPCLYFCNDKKK
jgi:hypothetical protein